METIVRVRCLVRPRSCARGECVRRRRASARFDCRQNKKTTTTEKSASFPSVCLFTYAFQSRVLSSFHFWTLLDRSTRSASPARSSAGFLREVGSQCNSPGSFGARPIATPRAGSWRSGRFAMATGAGRDAERLSLSACRATPAPRVRRARSRRARSIFPTSRRLRTRTRPEHPSRPP